MTREEAIKVAYGIPVTKAQHEALQFLIPELAESEDERIRKDIIGGLMWQRDNLKSEGLHDNNLILPGFCLTVGEHLKYLEKQKEHKSLNISAASEWLKEHVCRYMNSEYNEFHKCVEYDGSIDKERLINDFENAMQKEQKPNYCHYGGDPSVERCKYCYASCSGRLVEERYSPLCNTIKDKIHEYIANHFIADTVVKTDMRSIVKAMEEGVRLGKEEQKPAEWSKEDDLKLGALITDIETRSDLTETIKIKYVSFLKSLRPQPKQEWSEEDEAHRKFISESLEDQIRFCKKDAEGAYYANQIRTAQNWLNDLPTKFNTD